VTLRIAVCHPYLGRGGSEARALWLLQALRETHEPTLITLGPVPLDELNTYYGTTLQLGDFEIQRPRTGRWSSAPGRLAALQGAVLRRHAAARVEQFDLMVSAYNPIDFGRPGVQFIADFSWLPSVRQDLHGGASGPEDRRGWKRRVYQAVVRRVGRGAEAWTPDRADVLVANSAYARRVLAERAGLEAAAVIHPPVAGEAGGPPAGVRRSDFLSLGRIAPEKRIEEQIAILRDVRARGHDVGLRLCGGPLEGAYAERIRDLVRAEGGWLTWGGWLEGAAKWAALREYRYAIHTTRGEAFGIAVAEMMRAGCSVFVPAEGAPAELVGAPELVFADHAEAVAKICACLGSPALQQDLCASLQARGEGFSAERFSREALALLERIASGSPDARAGRHA
jgi:glycosyltransferase involved in cell wall biosynthesis